MLQELTSTALSGSLPVMAAIGLALILVIVSACLVAISRWTSSTVTDSAEAIATVLQSIRRSPRHANSKDACETGRGQATSAHLDRSGAGPVNLIAEPNPARREPAPKQG